MTTSSKFFRPLSRMSQAAIRVSLALSLSLSVSWSSAQQTPKLEAPVNVAWELYFGCIKGSLTSSRLDHKSEVNKFVADLDNYCLQWTVIWYSTQPDRIGSWSTDKLDRFNGRRVAIIAIIKKDLLLTTPK